jgi:hypothetical protein
MANVKFDGKVYDVDTLPKEAKQRLRALQIAESEIARLKAQLNIAQTARQVYARAVKEVMPKDKG